jgi:hypothetical protein
VLTGPFASADDSLMMITVTLAGPVRLVSDRRYRRQVTAQRRLGLAPTRRLVESSTCAMWMLILLRKSLGAGAHVIETSITDTSRQAMRRPTTTARPKGTMPRRVILFSGKTLGHAQGAAPC